MRPAVKVARIAGASRHSRLETEPSNAPDLLIIIWLSKTSVRGKRSARIADLSLSHVILIDSKGRSVAPMCSLVLQTVCVFFL